MRKEKYDSYKRVSVIDKIRFPSNYGSDLIHIFFFV